MFDEFILAEIFEFNSYGLPLNSESVSLTDLEAMSGQICIDVGAHVGGFALLAASLGAEVHAFEAQHENFECLRKNAKAFPNLHAYHRAVWRGDKEGCVYINEEECPPNGDVYAALSSFKNSGLYSCSDNGVIKVESESLDSIIESICGDDGFVDFLKIDCEGSEYEILYTCSRLNQVKKIVGELHFDPNRANERLHPKFNRNVEGFRGFLESEGFSQVNIYNWDSEHPDRECQLFNFRAER